MGFGILCECPLKSDLFYLISKFKENLVPVCTRFPEKGSDMKIAPEVLLVYTEVSIKQ